MCMQRTILMINIAKISENQADDFADKVIMLLSSPTKRAKFGEHSKLLARRFTEARQTKKLETIYKNIISSHHQSN